MAYYVGEKTLWETILSNNHAINAILIQYLHRERHLETFKISSNIISSSFYVLYSSNFRTGCRLYIVSNFHFSIRSFTCLELYWPESWTFVGSFHFVWANMIRIQVCTKKFRGEGVWGEILGRNLAMNRITRQIERNLILIRKRHLLHSFV